MVWNIGFDDGMGVTYAMQELDGDIRKIEYVDATPEPATVGGRFEPGQLNAGRRIKPDNVPTKFLWGGPKSWKIPDALYGRGMLLVSERLKALIERFEPGVHQFFPIDVVFKSDSHLAAQMYFLNICSRLDTVDRKWSTVKMDYSAFDPGTGMFVFNLSQIGDHHLWHDKHIFAGLYASDAFRNAAIETGITGFVFSKRKDNTEFE